MVEGLEASLGVVYSFELFLLDLQVCSYLGFQLNTASCPCVPSQHCSRKNNIRN